MVFGFMKGVIQLTGEHLSPTNSEESSSTVFVMVFSRRRTELQASVERNIGFELTNFRNNYVAHRELESPVRCPIWDTALKVVHNIRQLDSRGYFT